jgi:ABC-type phosphate/phosphonate transport system substrate-binding protein
MKGLNIRGLGALVLTLSLAGGAGRWAAADSGESRTPSVRIALVGTLFRDQPAPLVLAMMRPFGSVMQAQTGVPGELVPGGDPFQVARTLVANEVQLAVLHGFEFAWVKQRHPELQPLMIAVNQHREVRCNLVVNRDCKAGCFADLKGQVLALPKGTREHVRMYMNRRCEAGGDARNHFGKVAIPATAEDALDDVVDGEAHVSIVDEAAFDAYKRRKPARCEKLKTIDQSEAFPAGVIVYQPGVLDEQTLQRFREGMLNAEKTALGKQMLMMWRLTGFEQVPANYDEALVNIIKAYPPPAGK